MPVLARPPVRLPPAIPVLRPVEPGQVMPFHRHPWGELSEIRVAPPMTFPELVVWDATGQRPVGLNFGLPLPESYRQQVEAA